MKKTDTPSITTWDGKGRPPRAIAEKIKEDTKRRRALTVKKKTGQIVETSKLDLFLEEFLRNGGNATQAALTVFNCSSVSSASSMGAEYLKKARMAARVVMERQGLGYGKMIEVAAKKMEDSKTPEWWDRLMKLAEYEDFVTKKTPTGPSVVNIVSAQRQISKQFGFEEEEVLEADETE